MERSEIEKSFVLCFQSICTPTKLFEKLIERFNIPKNLSVSSDEIAATQKRVLDLFLLWVNEQFKLIPKDIIFRMIELCDNLSNTESLKQLSGKLKHTIQENQEAESKFYNLTFVQSQKLQV